MSFSLLRIQMEISATIPCCCMLEKAGIDRFCLTSNMGGWAPWGFVSSLQMLNFAFLKCNYPGELTPSESWLWDSWLCPRKAQAEFWSERPSLRLVLFFWLLLDSSLLLDTVFIFILVTWSGVFFPHLSMTPLKISPRWKCLMIA